jgi:hypothetical protein
MKFKKKPVIIEAYQFDGTYTGMKQIRTLFPNIKTLSVEYHIERNTVRNWKIGTLEGGRIVSTNDWIIQGIKGEYYPCKPDIFVQTYDMF